MKHYGKRPARHGAIRFLASSYMSPADLPKVPASFGHYGKGDGLEWQMLGNDSCGDCVWAGAAHETMVWTHRDGDGAPAQFTEHSVLSDYSAVTGFDQNKPDTDQGTDMLAAASYRRKTGVVDATGERHKIDAYLAMRPGDVDQLLAATYHFGAVGVGLEMPNFAEHQFDQGKPWDVVPTKPTPGDGHYVSCVGRSSAGLLLVVSWGRLQAMTEAFFRAYCDEATMYLSFESLKDGVSPEGFDADKLTADLAELA